MASTTLPQTKPYGRSWIYEWITTVDHKKIGIMYMVAAFTCFLIGGLLALVIRSELAAPGLQFVTAEQYNSVFGLHAINMIFLFVMPMFTGLGNYIVPIQVGAADMAFPRVNALSFWIFLGGAILIEMSFLFGGAPTG